MFATELSSELAGSLWDLGPKFVDSWVLHLSALRNGYKNEEKKKERKTHCLTENSFMKAQSILFIVSMIPIITGT